MKLIETRNPEEIRGGGLLKYCNLLCRSYRPAYPEKIQSMERYMCSRFFIDFGDVTQIQMKLENFLNTRFRAPDGDIENERLKYEYLMILYQVIEESTVCLPGCERTTVLALIGDLASGIYNSIFFGSTSFGQSQSNYLFHGFNCPTIDPFFDFTFSNISRPRGSLSSGSTQEDSPFPFTDCSSNKFGENSNLMAPVKRSRRNRRKKKNNASQRDENTLQENQNQTEV